MDFYEYDADVYADPALPIYYAVDTLEDAAENWQLHWHEATELLYCMEGSGVAVSGARRISLAAGELAFINPNRLHTFYASGHCRYCYLLLAPELAAARDLPRTPVQPFISDPDIAAQMDGIIHELQRQEPFYRSEVCARLTRLLVCLHRRYPEAKDDQETEADNRQLEMVKAIISYIRRHFAEPISLDDLCREMSFSRSRICHVFKEVTGQTLVEYIHFVRCNNARTLLASRQYNVSECAERSGFGSVSYFSRIYKKQMGVPPSSHR